MSAWVWSKQNSCEQCPSVFLQMYHPDWRALVWTYSTSLSWSLPEYRNINTQKSHRLRSRDRPSKHLFFSLEASGYILYYTSSVAFHFLGFRRRSCHILPLYQVAPGSTIAKISCSLYCSSWSKIIASERGLSQLHNNGCSIGRSIQTRNF